MENGSRAGATEARRAKAPRVEKRGQLRRRGGMGRETDAWRRPHARSDYLRWLENMARSEPASSSA